MAQKQLDRAFIAVRRGAEYFRVEVKRDALRGVLPVQWEPFTPLESYALTPREMRQAVMTLDGLIPGAE